MVQIPPYYSYAQCAVNRLRFYRLKNEPMQINASVHIVRFKITMLILQAISGDRSASD
jgi:hypothetical protein